MDDIAIIGAIGIILLIGIILKARQLNKNTSE